MDTIREFLDSIGLGKYGDVFVEHEIDMSALPHITDDDLKEIGVALGARRRLLAAIAEGGRPARDGGKFDAKEAARRQVTALFADISGFTRLSSGLDAEETHALLNGFFAAVDEVVSRYGGAIDKHIGDAVMAVFGAPIAHTDDPERALRAAGDIHAAVAALSPPLRVHIGVAAGQVVASSTGSAEHTEYTVTGDSVNLAARLTDLARADQTLVSASVRRALGERFEGEALGEQLIAGLPEPVTVWRLEAIAEAHMDTRRPFVGRRQERKLFAGAVADCLENGAGGTLLVRGEAGIGKTRLLEEFERTAHQQGFATHTGLVLDFGTAKGQDAVRALVRSLLEIAPNSGKRVRGAAADRAIAEGWLTEERRAFVNDLLDLEQTPALRGLYDAMDNDSRNLGKRETVADLARALSQVKPLLLKIEDLHWADAIVLEHAAHLVRETASSPILLLLTSRLSGNPFDDDWRAKCGDAEIGAIDLGPMAAADANELAGSFDKISSRMLESCIERAGGNPLFLEQLLYNADETNAGELPGSVQGIVQARLDALPTGDRHALQAASVLGQRFSSEAVAAVMSNGGFRPDTLLDQALIRPAGVDFHFAHALIRDGVYASLLKPQRIALHQSAAGFFHAADPVLYAEHLDQAEDAEAVRAYLAAARQQRDSFRFDTALRLVTRALELDSPTGLRFELMCFHSDLLRDLGRTADSIAAYERALAAAGSDEELCRANLGLAAGMRIADRGEDAMACLERAQTIAEENKFSLVLAEIHFLRGNLYFPMGRIDDCRAEHEASLRYAREAGSREAEARALGGLGDASYVAGHMRTANRHFSRCVELAAELGLRRVEAANSPMLAWSEFYLCRLDQAERIGISAVKASLAISDGRAEIIAHNLLGEIFYLRGEMEELKRHGGRTVELARRIGAPRFEPSGMLIQARYKLFGEGDRPAAFTLFMEAFELAKVTGATFLGPWVLSTAAQAAGNAEERERVLREGERILDGGAVSHNYFFFYAEAMEACRAAGEWDRVRRYADALDNFTAEEPLEWSDFFIKRGRTLADFALGERGQATIEALKDLRDTAKNVGFKLALPAIEAALKEVETR